MGEYEFYHQISDENHHDSTNKMTRKSKIDFK